MERCSNERASARPGQRLCFLRGRELAVGRAGQASCKQAGKEERLHHRCAYSFRRQRPCAILKNRRIAAQKQQQQSRRRFREAQDHV